MHCPFCRHADSRVVDSREADDGTPIRRRRQCPECGRRFTTVETASLTVVKRSGATEPFSRDKVLAGVRKACQGRPVDEDDLALLAQRVEEAVRATGAAEIDAHEVGLADPRPAARARRGRLPALRDASTAAFDSLEDFEAEIALLRAEHEAHPASSPQPAADAAERQPPAPTPARSTSTSAAPDAADQRHCSRQRDTA